MRLNLEDKANRSTTAKPSSLKHFSKIVSKTLTGSLLWALSIHATISHAYTFEEAKIELTQIQGEAFNPEPVELTVEPVMIQVKMQLRVIAERLAADTTRNADFIKRLKDEHQVLQREFSSLLAKIFLPFREKMREFRTKRSEAQNAIPALVTLLDLREHMEGESREQLDLQFVDRTSKLVKIWQENVMEKLEELQKMAKKIQNRAEKLRDGSTAIDTEFHLTQNRRFSLPSIVDQHRTDIRWETLRRRSLPGEAIGESPLPQGCLI